MGFDPAAGDIAEFDLTLRTVLFGKIDPEAAAGGAIPEGIPHNEKMGPDLRKIPFLPNPEVFCHRKGYLYPASKDPCDDWPVG